MEPGAEWEDFMKLHYRMAPHTSGSGPSLEVQKKLRADAEKAFSVLQAELIASRADVLIVVANDQFVNFFYNNIPTFYVTLANEVEGQFTRHHFHYQNHKELGQAILKSGLEKGIDLSFGRAGEGN
jgi:2,3-dihydroxyphenylpropionate 1,2-dioxygenase